MGVSRLPDSRAMISTSIERADPDNYGHHPNLPPPVISSTTSNRFVVRFVLHKLDNNFNCSVPWSLGMQVAAWMRHAAATALREEGYPDEFVNSYVLGHGNGHGKHMSFVPVPTIRTMHSDGSIQRVMLMEP